ncbi:hypothetical protein HT136_01900 [Novosphingobium profundi]|uniref:hypothetical protein n=1 Tax=Novosphingobium profundi TaxID=1774954 RepID=UPI001BDB3B84|nr:hypothetical protein [Novosphingobium profundi]MBT0667120.1 hypothetical protein [Novosphingobium profundi]
MTDRFPWSVLQIAPTGDRRAIRKAYADAIKAMDLDADVEGYARLRNARDLALQHARLEEDARPDAGSPEASAVPEGHSGPAWPLAAPRLSRSLSEGSVRVSALRHEDGHGPSFGTVFPDRPSEPGVGATLELDANQSLSAPTLLGYGEIEAALGLIPGQSPFERLESVLTEDSAPHLEEPARIVASRALAAVIEDARSADISRQEQVENWLAGLLAGNWPRSAPLLEQATRAFSWQDEWHRFDARPPVRFIGAQVRAERFRSKVQDPAHRYHRAWRELNRTGPAGPFRGLRASREDVQFVLSGIRANFPHVEEELDPARIESWNKPVLWPRIVLGLCWLLLLLHLLGVSWPFGPRSFQTPDGTRIELSDEAPDPKVLGAAIDAAVADSFGKGHDLDWLWARDPVLGETIVIRVRDALQSGKGETQVQRLVANFVRQATYLKGRTLSGAPLEELGRLRLDQLRAARNDSPAACLSALNTAQLPDTTGVSPGLRTREREAAARLASLPLPNDDAANNDATIHIPGALVTQVLESTGLPETTVRAALQDEGPEAVRCTVSLILLEVALDWDGDAAQRTAILRSL